MLFDFETVWPPSEKSYKAVLTFLAVASATLCSLFRHHKTSKKAKEVLEKRLNNHREGRRLLIESVQKKDQLSEAQKPTVKDWEEGLPEASRVMGYLWDSVYEQPTVQLGLENDDNHFAMKRLLNRALRAELKKAEVFTLKAIDFEKRGVIGPVNENTSKNDSSKEADEEWLRSNETNLQEVGDYLSGEKLRDVVEMGDDAEKNLGRQITEVDTKSAMKKCKTLCKRVQFSHRSVYVPIFRIALRVAPYWVLSNVFFAIHILGWTEFDRILFSGEIGLAPLRSDGSYDSNMGFQLACNCLLTCAVWWLAHAVCEGLIKKTISLSTLLLRSRLVECLLFQDYAYFETHSVGKLQALVNDDAQEVGESLFNLPKEMIGAVTMILIKLYTCFQIAPAPLVFQCLAPIPCVAFLNKKMMDYGNKEDKKSQKIRDHVSSHINDVLSNLRTVRTFANERREVSCFQGCVEQQSFYSDFASVTQSAAISVFIFCITASVAWSTYLAGKSIGAGEMRVADATVFSINMLHQVHLWQNFFNVVPRVTKMMRPLNRVINLLKSESLIEPNPNNIAKQNDSRQLMPGRLMGRIRFDNVKFHYPTDLRKQVLAGMTFEIQPGQKVGICGSAGCGKSTTMDLIQRLYDVGAGSGGVYIDGVDIRQYDIHFLRQRIGVVAQRTVLFKSTVRENIWYGMDSYPGDAAVEQALKQAEAWEFIQEKPDKLLTILTETGGGFSGGQMQRLAIARCLIRNPDVILLDEATAALDPVNERLVQDALDKITAGRYTTLAIAHRLTTIKDADKIIVLDKGVVVEEGSHTELMKKAILYGSDSQGKSVVQAGFYRNQWETQFNTTADESTASSERDLEPLPNLLTPATKLQPAKRHISMPPVISLQRAATALF